MNIETMDLQQCKAMAYDCLAYIQAYSPEKLEQAKKDFEALNKRIQELSIKSIDNKEDVLEAKDIKDGE